MLEILILNVSERSLYVYLYANFLIIQQKVNNKKARNPSEIKCINLSEIKKFDIKKQKKYNQK